MAQPEELYLGHKEIMEENNLKQSDLPTELNNKLIALNLRIADYQSNPTPALKTSIEQESAKIGHDILDHVESNLPDEPEGGQAPAPAPTPPAATPQEKTNQNNSGKGSKGIFDWLF